MPAPKKLSVEPVYSAVKVEEEVLSFWKKNKIYEQAKEISAKGKPFYFLDGPPYTSGKVHLGTAWNKSLKDMFLRYKRMRGFNVWDRAGYDMHGLPTESATQKKLGLETKEDIISFGVDRFIEECKKLCIENMRLMNKDFSRLGVWMDFDNAYQSIKKDFIEGEWWLIKRAYEQGRLYEGLRTMTWCPITESALAKHELEYKTVKDNSVFVKFRLKNKENEHLIIWTTTPWTIPFNLAVMVHPEIEYVKARVGPEHWYVAAPLASAFIRGVAEKDYEVVETLKGADLEGREYEHPFYPFLKEHYDKIKKNAPKTHTVLLSSEYVDTSSGTGIVHCAPGCGPEDYEVGHRNGIPPFNTIDTKGVFPESMGRFSGLRARKDDAEFVKALDEVNALVAQTIVEHEYPHDWRYHEPVIFRTTKQWFFRVEDLKEKMVAENEKITWVPKAAFNAFDSWLRNLRDNSISKQRFWGVPLPVWRNEKEPDDYIVVGSADELEKLSGVKLDDLHISSVDSVVIKKDGKTYRRVPDILDVWVDAGTVSWNCLDFPRRKDLFDKLFPADFILEGKDQIRGWFNLLMVASMLAFGKPSFKSVYMHGFINDALGRKMSKSLGNVITPDEVVDNHGADTFRYYMISAAAPGLDLNYNKEDLLVKKRNLGVLWNLHRFLIDTASFLGINPLKLSFSELELSVADRYILARTSSAVAQATEAFESLRLNQVPEIVENLFLEISRTYVQWSREAVQSSRKSAEAFLFALHRSLTAAIKMFAPVAPFITDKMFRNLKQAFGIEEESVHLLEWPEKEKEFEDRDIVEQGERAKHIIAGVLAARESVGLGVRWPLPLAVVETPDKGVSDAVNTFIEVIKAQANVRELKTVEKFAEAERKVAPNPAELGKSFGSLSREIISVLKSAEAPLLERLARGESVKMNAGGKEVTLTKNHVCVDINLPEGFAFSSFPGGTVFIDSNLTKELLAEGFSREAVRRIQQCRKELGMKKDERIELLIAAEPELKEMLGEFSGYIKDKVGAKNLQILSEAEKPKGEWDLSKKFKIKGKELSVHIKKV